MWFVGVISKTKIVRLEVVRLKFLIFLLVLFILTPFKYTFNNKYIAIKWSRPRTALPHSDIIDLALVNDTNLEHIGY